MSFGGGHLLQSFGLETLYFKLCCISLWGIDLDNYDLEGLDPDLEGHNVIINH